MKLLVVEDDAGLAAKLARALRDQAFAVDLAGNGEDALHLGETGVYDCAVLDLGLPVIDGISVLQHWRAAERDFPVLILTARYAWADKAAGFAAGADDYLTKPFLAEELIARLRALIRRGGARKATLVRCGDLGYDAISGAFTLAGEPLRLTAFETRILARLIRCPEVAVEREALFESVYEFEQEISTASFEVLIGRLRRKIGHAMIETVRGHGYRLTARGT